MEWSRTSWVGQHRRSPPLGRGRQLPPENGVSTYQPEGQCGVGVQPPESGVSTYQPEGWCGVGVQPPES